MRQIFTFIFFPAFLLLLTFSSVSSQTVSPRWQLGLNAGPTLFWGDVSVNEDQGDYFEKFQDDNQWAYGLSAGYRILPFSLLSADFSYGQLKGVRDKYEAGNMLNQSFEADYFDYALNLRVNLNDLIGGYDNNRLFSVYLHAGYGRLHYRSLTTQLTSGEYINSVGYENNGQSETSMATGSRFPVGGGLQFSLSDHFNLRLETTANIVSVDNIDATIGNTEINDIYSYTSLGVVYKFDFAKKKPEPEPEPEPEPAPEPVIAEEPVDVELVADIPEEVESENTINITYRLEKGDLNDKARFQQTLPMGVRAVSGSAIGAKFRFEDQVMSFNWDKLPKAESISMRIQLRVGAVAAGDYELPASVFYTENDEEKSKEYNYSITVKAEPEPVAEEPEEVEVPETSEITYRVQVRAIYNGKQPVSEVKKQLKVDEPVYEHFHNGYAKYSVGDFEDYSSANEYKRQLKSTGVRDAFVVAFHNNERLRNLGEVDKIRNPDPKPDKRSGKYYKIQIAATKNARLAVDVFAEQYDIDVDRVSVEKGDDGWYRYTLGPWDDYSTAKQKLAELKPKVKDAFVIRYIDGERK